MPTEPRARQRFRNPLLHHDVPDPDITPLRAGGWALVASSFDRAPGLPLWRSDDLMTWRAMGFAGGHRADAPGDGGVWAPSIRERDGVLYVVWGDPDIGVLVVEAPSLEGPWNAPRVLLAGRGLIDACPIWDDDQDRALVVHGYARSRAGFANRIDVFEADPHLTTARTPSRTIIDGDAIPGCTVLEGPKVYRREDRLWIFAPAGGVATGWQYVFRAPSWEGPWEHRTVLAQGGTRVNGPHQGAWVTGDDGEEWFAHFQAAGPLGRVLHLQPLRWGDDGWPEIGDPDRPGEPVAVWDTPRAGTVPPPPTRQIDDFTGRVVDAGWHSRGASRTELVTAVGGGRVRIAGTATGALLRPVDGDHPHTQVPVLGVEDAAASLTVHDGIVRELVAHLTEHGGRVEILEHTDEGIRVRPVAAASAGVRLGLRIDGDRASFTVDGRTAGDPFVLTGRRWTGAEWGLAARGPGHAVFGAVEVSA
ncbi:family 43 glycosylhydrolase [Microbacterium sp. 1P10UB]|uniref:family 43 glycosylhydrolase n=1 Tax=unclassified Microbacterium TaxID=2609290 RepID=UPI0039A33F90